MEMDEKKRRRLSLVMWAGMFLLVCGLYVGQLGTGRREFKVKSHKWDKLMLVLEQIERNYVDSVAYGDLVEKILPHVMENLDPHSMYLPPVELEAVLTCHKGKRPVPLPAEPPYKELPHLLLRGKCNALFS